MSQGTLYDTGAPTTEVRIVPAPEPAMDEPSDEESIANALIPSVGVE
jgi:hypothetical protein